MRIVITNTVLSNTGDAAILEAIIKTLREQRVFNDAEVLVLDSDARATSALYPEWTVLQQPTVSPPRKVGRIRNVLQRVRLALTRTYSRGGFAKRVADSLPVLKGSEFFRAFRALQSADLVISSGGTYLVDHYNFTPRAMELEVAKASGATVVLWTQSAGPFVTERARATINRIGRTADLFFARDQKSLDAWRARAGSGAVDDVAADVVFALPAALQPTKPAARILLSVREWKRGVGSSTFDASNYAAAMRAAALAGINSGMRAVALSTCQGVPRYAYDDSALALRLFDGLNVQIDRSFHRPAELLAEVADSQVIVTTRMHLAIMALLSGVPVIAVAYEFKTLELFRGLGLAANVVAIEAVDEKWLRERVLRAVAEPDEFVLSADRRGELAKEATKPAEVLASMHV